MSTRLLLTSLITAAVALVLVYAIVYCPYFLKNTLNIITNITKSIEKKLWFLQRLARQITQIVLPSELNVCKRACSLDQVLRCYFRTSYIDRIGSLIFTNRRVDKLPLAEKIWLVLWWVSSNIRYNYTKARQRTFCVQTPYVTLLRKSGVCVDYAVLTAALLLYLNVSPVYIVVLKNIDHAVVIVKVNGTPFVLDQHLPPIEIQDYAQYLAGLRSFNNVTIYELAKVGDKILIRKLYKNIFKLVDDYPEDNVSRQLVDDVMKLIDEATGLVPDRSLKLLEQVNIYTFRLKRLVGIVIGNRAIYVPLFKLYDPKFEKEWAQWIASMIMKELSSEFRRNTRFWITINSTYISVTLYNYSICNLLIRDYQDTVLLQTSCAVNAVGLAVYLFSKYERPVFMILKPEYTTQNVPYITGVWNVENCRIIVTVPKELLCQYIEPNKKYVIFLIGKSGEIRGVGELLGSEICR